MDDLPERSSIGPVELRSSERVRFIKEQRKRPSLWISLTGASLKYALFMLLGCMLVVPPAIFFWSFLIANTYQIAFIQELLAHVSLNSLTPNSVIPSIDSTGLALWGLVSMIFLVIGWLVFPFTSPLQRAADNHMMNWMPNVLSEEKKVASSLKTRKFKHLFPFFK